MGGNYFGVSSTVYDELMRSGKPPALIFDNILSSPEYGFQIRNAKIVMGGTQ